MPWTTVQLPVYAKAGRLQLTAAWSMCCTCTYTTQWPCPPVLRSGAPNLAARSSIGELTLTAGDTA